MPTMGYSIMQANELSPTAHYAIEALNIRKSFAGVPALRGCNLRIRRGEIHALLGQNGAGKSTLVKILNGVYTADGPDDIIRIRGTPVVFRSVAEARRSGIGYVPQEIEVIEQLSVAENIFAGQTGTGKRGLVNWQSLLRRATALLKELGLPFDPAMPVALLPPAQRHLVMIARALVMKPAVLILDEPTASLSNPEIERLFLFLAGLKAAGTTMIYITHRLPEVFTLCDRVSVLRDGLIASEFDREAFSVEGLLAAMSGSRINHQYPPPRGNKTSQALLTVDNLSVIAGGRQRLRQVSFQLREGEILGIAGVLGAGRTELLSALYGYLPHAGCIRIKGREQPIASVRDARKAGIALLTEDRKRQGLFFNLPVYGNISIGNLDIFSRAGVVSARRERQGALRQMDALSVKASLTESVAHLSGGNQQKLLFARVLIRKPRILLLDELSKGVDAATRQEIYRLIAELANMGTGIIVVSSELEEVLGLSDRCLVMADGRIVDEFARGEGDEARVLSAVGASRPNVARTITPETGGTQ